MHTTSGFLLYVDGKALGVGKSLKDAKAMAVAYTSSEMRIESRTSPPSQIQSWTYDVTIQDWIES